MKHFNKPSRILPGLLYGLWALALAGFGFVWHTRNPMRWLRG
jgi:hypothetical protein